MTDASSSSPPPRLRPTRAELEAARGRAIPDVTADDLVVLFCGINPGLWSGLTGWHFAKAGNRFWKALHLGGFTPAVLHPSERLRLLEWGYGITNVVARATATADELAPEEYVAGGRALVRKVRRRRPRWLAVLGIGAYRLAFGRPLATIGPQEETIGGTRLWVLPNPSGLNAHYGVAALGEQFRALHEAAHR